MSKSLELGHNFSVPLDILTSAIGVIGVRGSGKTTTAGVLVEEAIGAGVPCVITDPTGAWHGLKSSADGKSPGLSVYVFGGEHADVPLEPDSGKIVARFVVEKRVPVVLDVSLMSKGQQIRFVADFHEEVYQRNRDPLLVVVDETARFCPQTARGLMSPDVGKCIGAIDDIAALGRRRGLGVVLIGQRPARINKDVLTQCHTLIAMQITSPQDRKAVNEWVEEQHGSDELAREFTRSLTTLKVGEGFVWSPTMLGVFKRVHFRNRRTFDSSATPKVGQKAIEPKVFAQVDLEALTSEIAAARERAKADDPKVLRTRIRELEQQLAQRPNAAPEVVEKYILQGRELEAARSVAQHFETLGEKMSRDLAQAMQPALAALGLASKEIDSQLRRIENPPYAKRLASSDDKSAHNIPKNLQKRRESAQIGTAVQNQNGQVSFRAGALRMLQACGQFEQRGLTRSQIVALAGVKAGGTFSTYINELLRAGFLSEQNGRVWITQTGILYLGPNMPMRPATAREILAVWRGEFRAGGQRMLDIIVDAYPDSISRRELADRSEIAAGGTFSTYLNELKRAELVEESREGLRAVVLDLVDA